MIELYRNYNFIKMAEYTITKKIAKQGKNNIIIIPTILKHQLKSKTLVKVTIEIIEEHKK